MTQILRNSRYSPARGGHAPNDVRNAFLEAVDAFEEWERGSPEPKVELREQMVPITELCGLLWNCNDQLPGIVVAQLEDMGLENRWTYAMAARALKAELVG